MICLSVPVPGCVQEHLREPPVCYPKEEDGRTLDLIRKFGAEFGCSTDEVEQACNLASGLSDLIVILERPRPDHTYKATFSDFVQGCPTLSAVDELIRFASRGLRSIHTVTVLDAFTFSPKRPGHPDDPERIPPVRCSQLVDEIIMLKKPKVVLCCWMGPVQGSSLSSQLRSRGVGTWPPHDRVEVGSTSTIAIRSFHPATAVFYRQLSPHTRMLLIYHFILAFAKLHDSSQTRVKQPQWTEEMCRGSSKERNDENLSREKAASRITTTLRIMMEPTKFLRIRPLEERRGPPPDEEMNLLLRRLFSSDYSGAALPIVQLCLLFKGYQHPAKKEILAQLYEIGSRQDLFLSPCSPRRTLYVGFGDDDDDEDLHLQLGSLDLEDRVGSFAHSLRDITEEEKRTLASLEMNLRGGKAHLEQIEQRAAALSSRVLLSVRFGIHAVSADRITLAISIAEATCEMISVMDEVAALINAAPAILAGELGVFPDEEQPKRPLIRSRDGRVILDRVIWAISPVVDAGFRCCLLFTGIMAQANLLTSATAGFADSLEKLASVSTDVTEYIAQLQSARDILIALRAELNTGEQLVAFEDQSTLGRKKEKGLRAVYDMVYDEAQKQRRG